MWGIWGFAIKLAVDRAHPFAIQWMYALPNILFIPVWYFLARKAVPDAVVDLSALGWAFLAAACAAGAMLLMFFALQSKPATLTVAMTSAYPIVTLFLALVTRAETINIRHVLGIVLIIAGVVVLQL